MRSERLVTQQGEFADIVEFLKVLHIHIFRSNITLSTTLPHLPFADDEEDITYVPDSLSDSDSESSDSSPEDKAL